MKRPRSVIIGLGQDAAGDDGAGLAVIRHLRMMDLPDGVEMIEQGDPSALIDYLVGGAGRVIVVDAASGAGPSGRVLEIDPSGLERGRLVSTHGVGVIEAIEIARALNRSASPPRLSILAITVEHPSRGGFGLSSSVAAAVPIAAHRALAMASGVARKE